MWESLYDSDLIVEIRNVFGSSLIEQASGPFAQEANGTLTLTLVSHWHHSDLNIKTSYVQKSPVNLDHSYITLTIINGMWQNLM